MGRGAALRGFGKVLAKHLKKVPVLGSRAKVGMKAGMKSTADVAKKVVAPSVKLKVEKQISPAVQTRNLGILAGTTLTAKKAGEKQHKETKEKLTKSVEEHKKKTKEQKEKQKK